jgi:hypothetical protein
MARLIYCGIIFALFILFDLIPIAKKRDFKAFWFYLITVIICYTVHIFIVAGFDIPSPTQPIGSIVRAIFGQS